MKCQKTLMTTIKIIWEYVVILILFGGLTVFKAIHSWIEPYSAFEIYCGGYDYCSILEKLWTPLIKALMRLRPHNRTFWKDIRACVRVYGFQQINTVCALYLTNQIAPAISTFSPFRCAPLAGFLCRASPVGSVSLPFCCS